MPRFIHQKDVQLMKNLSQQLIHDVMQIYTYYYKLDENKMNSNVYGQNMNHVFKQPIKIPSLVQHSPQTLEFQFGLDYRNNTIFRYLKSTLDQINLLPQIGDIIFWDNIYWQITIIITYQYIGGLSNRNWAYECQTTVVNKNKVKQITNQKQRKEIRGESIYY